MILFNFISLVAVTGTIFINFYSICLCRFILGFSGGIFSVTLTRMIEETVPSHLLGTFGIVTNLAMNAGNMVSILQGLGLPDPSDGDAKTNQYWRIIFGFPWILQVVQITLLFHTVKYEPIKYLIERKRDKEALLAIR